ncbi:MAG: MBL fold metallo-hydrolase [Pseudomonadota bacterium]
MTKPISRRSMLAATATVSMSAAVPAWAAAPMLGAATPKFNRFKLGAFEVTNLLVGTRTVENPHNIFGLNVSDQEFEAASKAALIPSDKVQFFFTPTVVNTGETLILFDTGLSAESITDALGEAGYTADMVDHVIITHMHGDHVGGMINGGAATFPNAVYSTGAVEFDAWTKVENALFDSNVRPFAEKTTMMDDGASAFSGHTAMAAFGHTPGHMVHMIESDGHALLITADLANHYIWSLAHPDWEVTFDVDKAAAAVSRRRVLDMLAADKIPFAGYHMPWPGVGFVETRGEGFHYVPSSYQMML